MTRPNIVLIVSDQHRRDWMGCAGNRVVETPTLDALAARGVRFTDACCNAPLCGPSRMSMLTGQHPYRNGVYINEHTLSSDVPTFAHALGLAGYETVLAGRMHFMNADQRHGFQSRLVGDICRCYAGGPQTDFSRTPGSASNGVKAVQQAHPGTSAVLEYDQAVTAAAVDYLAARTDDRPLLLTVGTYGPHHPFTAPPEYYDRARRRLAELGDEPVPHAETPLHPWHAERYAWHHEDTLTREQIAEARANYAGMIGYLDELIARVLESARQHLTGPTWVVYVSDHGESAGDHGLMTKCSFYQSSVGVPMIFAPLDGPVEGLAGGRTFEAPVSLLDLCPTLAELAGGPTPPLQDGDSLAPILAGPVDEAQWRDRPIFSELKLLDFQPIRMVRRGDWKLVYYHTLEPVHLFNLAADPDEQVNRAADPACAAVRDALLALMLADWDPEWINRDAARKNADLKYMAQWGRQVGLGPMELWDQPTFTQPGA